MSLFVVHVQYVGLRVAVYHSCTFINTVQYVYHNACTVLLVQYLWKYFRKYFRTWKYNVHVHTEIELK
jgi:hypothetical protein